MNSRIKNQIKNYFVVPDDKPKIFLSPVTLNANVGKILLEKQLKKELKDASVLTGKKLLHVCLDMDSMRLYLPNRTDFLPKQIVPLLKVAIDKIESEHGEIENKIPIDGSPFSFLRMRRVSSFEYVRKSIGETFPEKPEKPFEDLVVIEANLVRMPTTTKSLPKMYQKHKNYIGGYVGKDVAKEITFYDEINIKGKNNGKVIPVLTQRTPFILIDISPTTDVTVTEKEWAILSGYRDHLYASGNQGNQGNQGNKESDLSSFADMYAAKRHLYLGYPFEEVCYTFLKCVNNFGELINGIQLLTSVARTIEKEGYANPSKTPYYITFKIDPLTFPLRLESIMKNEKEFDPSMQIDAFRILEYNLDTNYILIESPAFIEGDLCTKILKAKSRPFICRYNKTMNLIDAKVTAGLLKELELQSNQIEKIKRLIAKDENLDKEPEIRADARTQKVGLSNPSVVNIRKISEYYYACDHIKKMCKERGIEFVDLDVVIGPLERIFGAGTQGGFMSKKCFEQGKMKIPYQLVKGIWVSPPVIAVNSSTMPSYDKQTETLIHEYSHNLYNIAHPEHENLYNKEKGLKNKDELKWWYLYLTDEDERMAHKEEIKYSIQSGVSVDEIIRDKIGGSIKESNMKRMYPIAMKFKELVDEAVKEMEV